MRERQRAASCFGHAGMMMTKRWPSMRRTLCLVVLPALAVSLSTVSNPGATSGAGKLFDRIAAMNAEQLAIKEGKSLVGKERGLKALTVCPTETMVAKGPTLAKLLEREGCVGLRGALSSDTCASLRAWIDAESDRAKAEVEAGAAPFDARFGGVNCRGTDGLFGRRQDMYLPVDAEPVRAALTEFARNLRPLLEPLVGADATLHEVSCLVADPGSPRQCIHADTIVLPCPQYPEASMAPLYTFFMALQDVEDDMGHTLFLPETHTDHALWNVRRADQEKYIASRRASRSKLAAGDVAIFDSRCLHAGLDNTSKKRRVLFYCTISAQDNWPLPGGLHGSNSIRAEDRWRWRLRDFLD